MKIPKMMFSGKIVDLSDPEGIDYDLLDIVAGLAQPRYYGAAVEHGRMYSILDHSIALHDYCKCLGCSPVTLAAALLHDAAEAYVGDMHGPLKHSPALHEYRVLERDIQRAIDRRFGFGPLPPPFADLDKRLAYSEILHFWPDSADAKEWAVAPLFGAERFISARGRARSIVEWASRFDQYSDEIQDLTHPGFL